MRNRNKTVNELRDPYSDDREEAWLGFEENPLSSTMLSRFIICRHPVYPGDPVIILWAPRSNRGATCMCMSVIGQGSA
jgi:hypothetical protein